MPYQRELEVKLLWRLYVRLHEGIAPISQSNLQKSAQSSWKVSDFRFDDAFHNLQKWKYLKEEGRDGDGTTTYRLSARGVDWVEGWYKVVPVGISNYEFHAKHKGTIYVDELRYEFVNRTEKLKSNQNPVSNGHFWTKWGSVAAIAAIPTSILIWYFS